jgi:hypothetical protein
MLCVMIFILSNGERYQEVVGVEYEVR